MVRKPKPRFDTKKWTLMGLGVFAAGLVILLFGLWIWFLVSFKVYRNDKDGVEISYPRSWVVKDHPMNDVLVGFLSPKENALDTFLENVNLSTYDMSKNPLSIDEYAKVMMDQMTFLFKDLSLVEKSVFPMSGRKGYRMVLRARGETPLLIVVYALTKEETGYNLLYIGASDRYGKDRLTLDAMALSLKVKY